MMDIVDRYNKWFAKTIENIRLTKDQEGQALTSRFQCLTECKGAIDGYIHSNIIKEIIYGFCEDRKNLKWAEKFKHDIEKWNNLFESTLPEIKNHNGVLNNVSKLGIDKSIDLFQS